MADKLGILFDVGFDDGSAQSNLEKLINKLKQNNKLDLVINSEQFDKLEKEFAVLKSKFESQDIKVKIDNKEINELNSMLDKVVTKQVKTDEGFKTFERSISQTNNELKQTVSITEKINSQTGEVTDVFKTTTDDTKKLNSELEKIQSKIDKTVLTREKEAKILEERQAKASNKALEQEWKDREKIQDKINETINKRQKEQELIERNQANVTNKNLEKEWNNKNVTLFNEIKSLNNDIFNVKKQIINTNDIPSLKEENTLYRQQLESLNEKRRLKMQSLIDKGGMNEERELTIRKQIQDNLEKTYTLENLHNIQQKKVTDSLEEQVKLYRQMANIKLQNLQTRYGKLTEIDDIKKQIDGFKKSLEALNSTNFNTKALDTQFKQLEANIKSSDQALKITQKDAMSTFDLLKGDFQKFTALIGVGAVIATFGRLIKEGIGQVMKLDDQLNTLKITMNGTDQSFRNLAISAQQTSKDLGANVDTVMRAITVYGNMTETAQSLSSKIKAPIVLSNISGMDVDQATDAVQGISKEFQLAQDEGMKVADILSAVSANMAVDFKKGTLDITDAVRVSGAVAKESGFSLEQYSAIIGGLLEKTRGSGSEVGNAMKSIIANVGRIKNASDEITDKDMAKAEKALKTINIDIRDSQGELKAVPIIFDEITQKWSGLSKSMRSMLAESLGNVRRKNVVIDMFDNMSRNQEIYQSALESSNFALKANEKYLESNRAKVEGLKSSFQMLFERMIKSSEINTAITGLTGVLDVISMLTSKIGLLGTVSSVAFAIIASKSQSLNIGKKVFGDMTLSLSTFEKSLYRVGTKINTFSFKNMNLNPIKMLQTYIDSVRFKYDLLNSKVAQNAGLISTQQLSAITKITNGFRAWIGVTLGEAVAQTTLKVATIALNAVIGMGLGMAISFVVGKITHWINKTKEMKQANEELQQSVTANVQQYRGTISQLQGLKDEYTELSLKTKLTAEEQKRLYEVQNKIGELAPETVTSYDSQGNAILNLKKGVDGLIDSYKEKIKMENMQMLAKGDDFYKTAKKDIDGATKELNRYTKERQKLQNDIQKYKSQSKTGQNIDYNKFINDAQLKINALDSKISNTKNKLTTANEWWKPLSQSILSVNEDFNKMDANMQRVVSNFVNMPNKFNNKSFIEIKTEIDSFIKLLNNAKTQPLITEINKLNKGFQEGKVPVEEYNTKLLQLLKELSVVGKIDLKELQELFKLDASTINTDGIEKAKINIKDLQEQIQNGNSAISEYNHILDELNEHHALSSDTVGKIISQYPDMIQYLNDEGALREKLKQKIQEEVETNQEAMWQMMQDNVDFYNAKIKGNTDLVNEINSLYNVDLGNYSSLAEMKEGVTNRLIESLSRKWSEYLNIMADGTAELNMVKMSEDMTGVPGSMNMAMVNAQKEVNAYNDKIKGITSKLNKLAFSGTTAKMSKIGSDLGGFKKNKKGKSSKSSADKRKRDAEKAKREAEQALKKALDNAIAQYDTAIKTIENKITNARNRMELYNEDGSINRVSLIKSIETFTNQKLAQLEAKKRFIQNSINSGKYDADTIQDLKSKILDIDGALSDVYTSLKKIKVEVIDETYKQKTVAIIKEIEKLKNKMEEIDSADTFNKQKLSYMDSMIEKIKQQRDVTQLYVNELERQRRVTNDIATRSALEDSIKKYREELQSLQIEIIKSMTDRKNLIKDLTFEIEKLDEFNRVIEETNENLRKHNYLLADLDLQIELLKEKMDFEGVDKLYGDYISAMNGKIVELRNQSKELSSAMDGLQKEFKLKFGVDISSMSKKDLNNLYQSMFATRVTDSKEEKEALEKQAELFKQLMEDYYQLTEAIQENGEALGGITNDILKKQKEQADYRLSLEKEVQDKTKEMMLKRKDDEKKILDERTKNLRESIEQRKKIWNDEFKNEDYNRDLQKKKDEELQIIAEIESKRRDTSLQGQAEVKRLEEELAKLQEDIASFERQHNRDKIMDNYDDQLEKAEKENEEANKKLDEFYSDENLNKMSYEAIAKGYFKDIHGNTIMLKDAMIDYIKTTSDGLSVIGQKIQDEIIAKLIGLQVFFKNGLNFGGINNIGTPISNPIVMNPIGGGIGDNGSIDIGKLIGGNIQPIIPNPIMPTPIVNIPMGGKTNENPIMFNIDCINKIEGNMYDTNDLIRMIEQGGTKVIQTVQDYFNGKGWRTSF